MQTRRFIAAFLVGAALLAACGDAPLSDTGRRSTEWIGEAAPSTLPVASTEAVDEEVRVAALSLSSAAGLEWSNDVLDTSAPGMEALDVIADVWRRNGDDEEFVQAHRFDIASALPGVKFPGAVPSSVEHVTSQLIYSSGGRLDTAASAAFGLWSVPPYSQSRAVGQAAVLFIGREVPDSEAEGYIGPCGAVEIVDALGCQDLALGAIDAAEVTVPDGVRLVWWDGGYEYDLFYRTLDGPEVAELMAESMVELSRIEEEAFDAYRGVAGRLSSAGDSAAPTR
jgi:hypothetical protein